MKSVLSLSCVLLGVTAGSLFAQPVDEHTEKINNIRKMIALTGGTRIVDQMFNAMAANFKEPMQQEIFQQFRKEMDINQIYDMMIPVWDKNISADDIKDIIRFYESAAGKRLLDAQPKIMAEAMPKIMEWAQDISKRMTEKIAEKMKEKEKDPKK